MGMTDEPTSDRGKTISKALQAQSALTNERASTRIAKRNEAGRVVSKLTEDDWADVLDRIANGELPGSVMQSFGVQPHALNAKEKRDPEFKAALSEAYAGAFFNVMIDARSVARGVEGYSSGNIERDKLIVDLDWKLAKALVPRLVDKQQIDQRSINITIARDDTEY